MTQTATDTWQTRDQLACSPDEKSEMQQSDYILLLGVMSLWKGHGGCYP